MDLKMNQSFLLNHYNIEETDNGYKFVTNSGISYFLTFISYPVVSEILSTNIYMFNIERENCATNGPYDEQVRDTVIYVLFRFFEKHEDALITICDIMDGKQNARKRLFDNWFRRYNGGQLLKIDSTCMISDTTTFVSLMFSANHYNKENLKEEFIKLTQINFYN